MPPTTNKTPKPFKRFTNGHKTFTGPQADFFKEIYNKDTHAQEEFMLSSSMLKKPRNPINGDLTSRDNAEYLLPFIAQTNDEERYNTMCNKGTTNDNHFSTFLTDVSKVESIKHRKEMIKQELEQIKHILAHKRVCMNAGGGTSATLHPALEQTRADGLIGSSKADRPIN